MQPQQPTPPESQAVEPATAVEQAAQQLAKQPRTVRDLLQGPEFRAALQAVLPRAMRADRFVRVALTAMMRTPELADCTRESLFKALLDLSCYGLEPDGRRAHLIPYKNRKNNTVECQLIIDYKGLSELIRRSGDVSYIHADVVYEKDEWDFSFGTNAHLIHKPHPTDRGKERVAFYSFVKLKDGSEDFRVMRPADVEKIRKRSKSPDAGPWVTDYDAMGIKTVFRQHSKWLPLSPEVLDAIEHEDATDAVDTSATWADVLSQEQPERKTLAQKVLAGEVGPKEPGKAEDQHTLLDEIGGEK
jgi:recombination protein RecT